MISSPFRQLGTSWNGSLWLIIQNFYIYHESELKNFGLDDSCDTEPFACLLFVNGDPKGNFQKYWLFSAKFVDVSKIRKVPSGKVCFADFLMLAYTSI